MPGPNDKPIAVLAIEVYADGALALRGPIGDRAWCLAALDNARDALNNHHRPKTEVVVPGRDVSLPESPIVKIAG